MSNAQASKILLRDCKEKYKKMECWGKLKIPNDHGVRLVFNLKTKRLESFTAFIISTNSNENLARLLSDLQIDACKPENSDGEQTCYARPSAVRSIGLVYPPSHKSMSRTFREQYRIHAQLVSGSAINFYKEKNIAPARARREAEFSKGIERIK